MMFLFFGALFILSCFAFAECMCSISGSKYDENCYPGKSNIYDVVIFTTATCALMVILMYEEYRFSLIQSLFPPVFLAAVTLARFMIHDALCSKAEKECRKVFGHHPAVMEKDEKESLDERAECGKTAEEETQKENTGKYAAGIDGFIKETTEIISNDGFSEEMKAAVESVNESLEKINAFPKSRTDGSDEIKRLSENYLPAALLLLKSYEEIVRTVPDETKRSREVLFMVQHTFEDMNRAVQAMAEGMIDRDLDKVMEAANALHEMLLKEIPEESCRSAE